MISPTLARRLAIVSQGLDAPPAEPGKDEILDTIRQITCVQLDPINTVARNPLLILWSRLGSYDPADFGELLWDDKALFEYWAHAASILPAEDFPLVQPRMLNDDWGNGVWARRAKAWWDDNALFRQYILDEMAARGPLYPGQLEDRSVRPWESSGWSNSRNISTMLNFMWQDGYVTVIRRDGQDFGLKKMWGLLEHQLPQWVDHDPLPQEEVTRRAAEKALKALGVGRPRDITNYFIRGRYPGLDEALAVLEADGAVQRVVIGDNNTEWSGDWYIHRDRLADLESLQNGAWRPHTTLLSPFDNLIADRDRTEDLFDFHYRVEIYTPKAKRKYGYYVMPILHNGRLVGRIDPKMDRKQKSLIINAVHYEPGIEPDAALRDGLDAAIQSLGSFLGAKAIAYPSGTTGA